MRKEDVVLGSLVADTYSLGAQWIYMKTQLDNSNLDWENLNAPMSNLHKSKVKGDFSHYGDQMFWLYDYVKKENKFEPASFVNIWKEKMSVYAGYIDESSRETLRNLSIPLELPCGGVCDDLSVLGRISPLLIVSQSEEEFVKNVKSFVLLTHYSEVIKESAEYIAKVLWAVIHGAAIIETMKAIKTPYTHRLKEYIQKGLDSKLDNTFDAIRVFGPGCDIEEGMPGVVYLINKYGNDFKTIMIENAKAGGDSSSRAMVIAMLLVAAYGKEIIPNNWIEGMNTKI